MEKLIDSARERVKHFEYAISLYDSYLKDNTEFQTCFLKLLEDIVNTEHSANTKKNVFFIAVGKSAGVARIASSMFVSVGLPIQFIHPTEALHGDFGIINPHDTVVFISNNGNSAELIQLIPGLQERAVTIYTITSKPQSSLALKSNSILQLPPVEEKCPLYQSPITSTLTTLALCQLLVAASVEKRSFSIESYAKNHPGGAIGKKIFLKADDVMFSNNELPIINPEENFQTLVSAFTSFAKGCLLVVSKEKKLMGLIAERDLRKSMEKFGPTVFQKTAAEIMNPKPTIARSGILAIDALKIMTRSTPYFNVLPILSDDNVALGILRIEDLLALGLE